MIDLSHVKMTIIMFNINHYVIVLCTFSVLITVLAKFPHHKFQVLQPYNKTSDLYRHLVLYYSYILLVRMVVVRCNCKQIIWCNRNQINLAIALTRLMGL